MAAHFPPQPVYPIAYDSDYTLFKVFNTSESVTTEDNEAWSEEIKIEPVCDHEAEIWADNGFASIDGELFYYDSVSKNAAGKVCALRACARNMGGTKTRFNRAGTWVRGVVVAETHNQMGLAIEIIEHYVMELESDLSLLENLPPIPDDCAVQSSFSFRRKHTDNVCPTYKYDVKVQGQYTTASIDFGDGNSSKDLSGEHTYCGSMTSAFTPDIAGAAGASYSDVNPVVTVESKNCSMSLGPGRVKPPKTKHPPTVPTPEIFIPDVPLPEYPDCDTPLKMPPFQFPLLEVPDVTMPPVIVNPTIPSTITFVDSPNIPDNIIVVDNIPSVIKVESDIPSVIKLEATVELICGRNYDPDDWDHHDWDDDGDFGDHHRGMGFRGENFLDGFNMDDEFITDSVGLGIPSEIHIIAPRMPNIKVIHDLPGEIRLSAPYIPGEIHIPELREHPLPSEIHLRGAENLSKEITLVNRAEIPKEILLVSTANIPHTIFVSGDGIPDEIPLRVKGMPKELRVTGMPTEIKVSGMPTELKVTGLHDIHVKGIPDQIRIVTERIPEMIQLRLMNEVPTYIFVDASAIPKDIRVTGFPDSIAVKVEIPELPPLKFEQDHIKLVYDGPPLQMQFPQIQGGELGEDVPCFAIIPCKR